MVRSIVTPRRRVLDALAHRMPDCRQPGGRVPFSWNFGPTPEMAVDLTRALAEVGVDWLVLRDQVDDIRQVSPTYIGPELPPGTDIWGIARCPHSYGTGAYDEISHHPLAGVQDPAALDDYPWPDPTHYDYAAFPGQVLAAVKGPEGESAYRAAKLAIATCGNPFEIYCWMTGLEESLVNVLLNPELVRAALERITGFFTAKMVLTLAKVGAAVELLYFADDLGGQRRLLMSQRAYRDVLKPYHTELFRVGKHYAPAAAVMFHSDGAVFDILSDLIEAGVEVLEAVQVDALGMAPERLKDAFGDRLAFHGGVSVQSLLPDENAATVEAECRRLVEVFGAGGGYIAAPTHAIQVGTPPENVLAMLRAVLGEADFEVAMVAARCG
jgi:uroporphyrinogen decarboxylase